MRNRGKTIGIIVCSISILILVIGAGLRYFVLESYGDLEESSMLTDLERARNAITSELNAMSAINGDYAETDDVARLLRELKSNKPVVQSDNDMDHLRLNLIIYLDEKGRIVFSKSRDFRDSRSLPFPNGLLAHLGPSSPFLDHMGKNSGTSGLISLPEGIVMIAASRVSSETAGTDKGTLIMGRFLDQAELGLIAQQMHLMLELSPLNKRSIPPVVTRAINTISVTRNSVVLRDRQTINGFCVVKDVYDQDACLLQVVARPAIMQAGQRMLGRFFAAALLLAILLGTAAYFVIERFMAHAAREQELEERYQTVIWSASDSIIFLDCELLTIQDANDAFCNLMGMSIENLRGVSLPGLFDVEGHILRNIVAKSMHKPQETAMTSCLGGELFVEICCRRITRGDQTELVAFIHDLTERRELESRLSHQSTHDPLTGLPNRNLLQDRLAMALCMAQRENRRFALLLIDLDRFKAVNDTLGHAAGDELLIMVAQRLKNHLRSNDTIARIGGDEFVALLDNVNQQGDILPVANRFLRELTSPFQLQGRDVRISASIGIALYPEGGESIENLFKHADTAMYHVKENGRQGICFYSDTLHGETERDLCASIIQENNHGDHVLSSHWQ